MNVSCPSRSQPTAFTLIELLVSMLVLTVLVVIVAQMTNQTSTISAHSQDKMDMDNQARLVLDRIDADLARMLKRKDVNYIFFKSSGGKAGANDAMFFYSESPAYFNLSPDGSSPAPSPMPSNKSSLALVGYRINQDFQLERLGKALSWDGVSNHVSFQNADPGAMVFLTYPSGSTIPKAFSTLAANWPTIGAAGSGYQRGTDFDYRIIGAQVFRLEICFQVRGQTPNADGTPHYYYSIQPNDPTVAITAVPTTSAIYNRASGSMYGLPNELTAVVTTIALLDHPTVLQNPGLSLQTLGAALPKTVEGSGYTTAQQKSLPGQVWQSKIDSGALATAEISQATAGKIRIYQRVTYLGLQ